MIRVGLSRMQVKILYQARELIRTGDVLKNIKIMVHLFRGCM